MKLKKSISLLLVLALSLMSFAFTASADSVVDTVNVALVADGNTAELGADDTFVVNVELTDISAQQLYGAQVTINFDPTVLQVVDEEGTATEIVANGIIYGEDAYNAVSQTGYFDYALSSIDNTAGEVSLVASKSFALMTNPEAKLECTDGTYTVGGIRFKALQTGMTGLEINMEGTELFCAIVDEKATATDASEAIRVGLPKVEEVTNPDDTYEVFVDTAVEDAIATLPATVAVTFDDDSTDDVAVTWSCADYDAEVAGDYTFVGALDDTDIDVNGKAASATLTVKKAEIESVADGDFINVPFGASVEQINAMLPATLVATMENDATADLAVEWTYEYEKDVTTGVVTATGTLDVGTKYLNTSNVTATYTINVSAAVEEETAGTIDTEVSDFGVDYEDEATKEDVIDSLPATVEIATEGGNVTAFITWECADFNSAVAGDYTFVGTIEVPANVTLESNTIEVVVTVYEAMVKEVVSVTALEDTETDVDSSQYLVDLFPEYIDVEYQDGTTGSEEIIWDADSLALKANRAGNYTLNGTVGENDFAISVQVTVNAIAVEEDPSGDVVIFLNNKNITGTIQNMFTSQIYVLETRVGVQWKTSNQSIAFVTADGKLVAQNPGTVTVTATDADGNVGSFTVRVALNPGTIASLDKEGETDELVIPFTDLGDYVWASRMICELADKGVISGKSETLYAPGDNVTRAEYASLLVRAMKLSANEAGKEFTDVAQGDWYYNAVQTASALGIVSGYEDGSFNPNKSITREEMAVMTLRAAEAAKRTIPAKTTVSFADEAKISGFAKDAVNKLAAAQIINGMGDGTFAPQATANRAQAAVIIYQLCEL